MLVSIDNDTHLLEVDISSTNPYVGEEITIESIRSVLSSPQNQEEMGWVLETSFVVATITQTPMGNKYILE